MERTREIREGCERHVAKDGRPVLVVFLRRDRIAQCYLDDEWMATAACRAEWEKAKNRLNEEGYLVQWRPADRERMEMLSKTQQWPKKWKLMDEKRMRECALWDKANKVQS